MNEGVNQMDELPRDIEEKLFIANQSLKAAGMREMSDGELRLYADQLMREQGEFSNPMDIPGGLSREQAAETIMSNPVANRERFLPEDAAPSSLLARQKNLAFEV